MTESEALKNVPRIDLTPSDRESAVFRKLMAYYEQRLALLRAQNDGNLGTDETNRKRGQIAECKSFLALAKPAPLVADDG